MLPRHHPVCLAFSCGLATAAKSEMCMETGVGECRPSGTWTRLVVCYPHALSVAVCGQAVAWHAGLLLIHTLRVHNWADTLASRCSTVRPRGKLISYLRPHRLAADTWMLWQLL